MWFDYLYYIREVFSSSTFIVLIVVFVIDTITGILLGVMRKSDNTLHGALESRQLLKGFYKKIGMLLIGLLSASLAFLTSETVITFLTFSMLIGHEGLSILENLSLLKIPIPKKIKSILEILYKKGENDDK